MVRVRCTMCQKVDSSERLEVRPARVERVEFSAWGGTQFRNERVPEEASYRCGSCGNRWDNPTSLELSE